MQLRERLYTVEDLERIANLPENADKFFELVDSVICQLPADTFYPTVIEGLTALFLGDFVEKHDLGYVSIHGGTYVSKWSERINNGRYILSPENALIPNVAFISKARLPELPHSHIPLAPDLVVEIVEPPDTLRAKQRKAKKYLKYGTRIVWLVYPKDRSVEIFTQLEDGSIRIQEVGMGGILDGGDVLSGFELKIRHIFGEKQERAYTIQDLERIANLPENADKRFELIEGVIEEIMTPAVLHTYIANRFGRFLDECVEELDLGYVFGAGCMYVLSEYDELVPDCSFVSKARGIKPPFTDKFDFAPDLVIEVVSPAKSAPLMPRIESYLKHGTKRVWVVHLETQDVAVWWQEQDGSVRVQELGIDDTLDGGDVLPGFKLDVRRVFPK